jgi:outer membrane receptor protein involved in Fe transport
MELSLNWGFSSRSSVWLGYDRVYRYPVFDERSYYQGYGQPFFDLALRAEEGNSYEAGFKYAGERNQLFLTGYFLQMENEIAFDNSISGGTGAGLNVNLGPVDRYGLDLTWKFQSNHWGIALALACLKTELRAGQNSGNEVPEVPRFRMTNRIWWEPFEPLRLSLLHRYVGRRYPGNDMENELARLDAYHLYDLSITVQTSPNSRIFAKVENLLDELYPEATSNEDFYPGSGRKLVFGAKIDF